MSSFVTGNSSNNNIDFNALVDIIIIGGYKVITLQFADEYLYIYNFEK